MTVEIDFIQKHTNISIHTPTRGVTLACAVLLSIPGYFNPHSHKGSDAENVYFVPIPNISIHTPTRGVTEIAGCINELLRISIHTPTRGVT